MLTDEIEALLADKSERPSNKCSALHAADQFEGDDRAAIIPIRRFRELWAMGSQAHGITLRFKNPNDAPAIAARLNVETPEMNFIPWQEIKKNFLEAIRFEKTMLFFLMFIITLELIRVNASLSVQVEWVAHRLASILLSYLMNMMSIVSFVLELLVHIIRR